MLMMCWTIHFPLCIAYISCRLLYIYYLKWMNEKRAKVQANQQRQFSIPLWYIYAHRHIGKMNTKSQIKWTGVLKGNQFEREHTFTKLFHKSRRKTIWIFDFASIDQNVQSLERIRNQICGNLIKWKTPCFFLYQLYQQNWSHH